MLPEQLILWNRIQDFEIDDPDSVFTFSERLCRENGWKLEYSLRVIEEYKKFMFLLCVSGHPCTPSDEVDQVWHLHLIYTHSYWEDFCEEVLQRKIHHGPTKGGKSEGEKYENLYEKTKESYRVFFKLEPPSDIWPSSDIRFKEIHFERVNRRRNWVLPKWKK